MTLPSAEGAIRSIVVAGNGLEAWVTALFLARTLRKSPTRISVLSSPRDTTAREGGYAHIPPTCLPFLEALGIGPRLLLSRAQGGFSLGMRFCGAADGVDCFLPFGDVGEDWLGCAFHLYWARAAGLGSDIPYDEFSIAGMAMRRGLFAPSGNGPLENEESYRNGMTCNPALLVDIVRNLAIEAEVSEMPASADQLADLGQVSSLRLTDGSLAEADLFVDAGGAIQDTGVADQIEVDDRPYATVRQEGGHWIVTTPLSPHRALRVTVPRPCGQVAAAPWRRNVVAVGRSAVTVAPILALDWVLLQEQLEALVDLLPGAACLSVETDRYNAQIAEIAGQAVDATEVASLLCGGRCDLEIAHVHDAASQYISLFGRRGAVLRQHIDVMPASEWAKLFLCAGLVPQQTDPFTEQLPLERLMNNLRETHDRIEALVERFPPYAIFIAGLYKQLGISF